MSLSNELSCVRRHYGPDILNQVHMGMATVATLTLAENTQPISIIYVGPSGSGKTLSCNLLTPDHRHDELRQYIVRVDKFTPKSFVSHAANVSADRLKDIDLLPKLENRCLVTKELAPLFRGKADELQENFSILISVLDGKGYVSTSGVRGTRGYDYEINFSWVGATTPLTNEVHRMMAQLGTRLLFYNTELPEKTEEELLEFALKHNPTTAEDECRQAVNNYLVQFFRRYKPRCLNYDSFTFPKPLLQELVRHAKLMCYLRAGFSMKKDGEDMRFSKPEREAPYRAIKILQNLAYGSALVDGRFEVNQEDIGRIKHICFSSMPEQRRILFQALVRCEGSLTVREVEEEVGMSKPTALHYMEELSHLELVEFDKGDNSGMPSQIVLLPEWKWLVRDIDCLPAESSEATGFLI